MVAAALLFLGITLVVVPAAGSMQAVAAGDPVIVVGGDIACPPGKASSATKCQQDATGRLVTSIQPNYVLPLGDSQYESGTAAEYAGSYDKTGWGASKSISRPAAGNHEYRTAGAVDYYDYFGASAGNRSEGYYSWDVQGPGNAFRWHMIALNSECAVLGGGSISAGCGSSSPQLAWLKADLAANKNVCTLAYWHRPRFSSSSTTPSSTTYRFFWDALYAAGADIVLAGHAHHYERFAPQTGAGAADPARGLTEFIVGSGGDDFQGLGSPVANSVVRNNTTFGVLKMTLHSGSYDYEFDATAGSFTDAGSGRCHSAPPPDSTPPSAATGLTATASNSMQASLSWTAANDNVGVKAYNIYRGANGSTRTLLASTTTNATSYTDAAVVAGTTYTYEVEAVDAADNVGPRSNVASVTVPAAADTTPPTAPTNLVVEVVSSTEVDLGWTASTDSGTGVSGYKVYRRGPGEPGFTLITTTAGTGPGSTSFQDLGVKPSSQYTYQVTAYDGAANESAASSPVSGTTPAGRTTRTFTFTPVADATVDNSAPTANAGGATSLVADNSPVNDALLRFDVATPGCDILTSASLGLRNNANGSTKGGDFYTSGTGWEEGTVTWNTAPARGALLNSLGAVASNASVTVDVTNGVKLNASAGFRIGSTSGDGVRYWSKEAAAPANVPKLTVVCTSP